MLRLYIYRSDSAIAPEGNYSILASPKLPPQTISSSSATLNSRLVVDRVRDILC